MKNNQTPKWIADDAEFRSTNEPINLICLFVGFGISIAFLNWLTSLPKIKVMGYSIIGGIFIMLVLCFLIGPIARRSKILCRKSAKIYVDWFNESFEKIRSQLTEEEVVDRKRRLTEAKTFLNLQM